MKMLLSLIILSVLLYGCNNSQKGTLNVDSVTNPSEIPEDAFVDEFIEEVGGADCGSPSCLPSVCEEVFSGKSSISGTISNNFGDSVSIRKIDLSGDFFQVQGLGKSGKKYDLQLFINFDSCMFSGTMKVGQKVFKNLSLDLNSRKQLRGVGKESTGNKISFISTEFKNGFKGCTQDYKGERICFNLVN